MIATDSGVDPPSSQHLCCTVRLCSVIRPEYAPPPDCALSFSRLITDTARILHSERAYLFYVFIYFLTGAVSVREILLRVEKLRPARLKRTEHGKNIFKMFFICTVVSNIKVNKAVHCFVGVFDF